MSTSKEQLVERVLEHHGIKGMKWGIRRSDGGGSSAPPAHTDHVTKTKIGGVLEKHGTAPLSNHELRTLIERQNLEQQVTRLNTKPSNLDKIRVGNQAVKEILNTVGNVRAAHKLVSDLKK